MDKQIPYGYCACGCGEKTKLANMTSARNGHIKGEPVKYIHNHHGRGKFKQFCVNGHERTPENLTKDGRCFQCSSLYNIEYRKVYYINNKENLKVKTKERQKENPEKYKEQNRKRSEVYRKIHPEEFKAKLRLLIKNNPEKYRIYRHTRRALKRNAFVSEVVPSQIYKRDWYTCMICKKPLDMKAKWPEPLSPSIDYTVPLSKGGTHEPSNVQAAHLYCNMSKGNRI